MLKKNVKNVTNSGAVDQTVTIQIQVETTDTISYFKTLRTVKLYFTFFTYNKMYDGKFNIILLCYIIIYSRIAVHLPR